MYAEEPIETNLTGRPNASGTIPYSLTTSFNGTHSSQKQRFVCTTTFIHHLPSTIINHCFVFTSTSKLFFSSQNYDHKTRLSFDQCQQTDAKAPYQNAGDRRGWQIVIPHNNNREEKIREKKRKSSVYARIMRDVLVCFLSKHNDYTLISSRETAKPVGRVNITPLVPQGQHMYVLRLVLMGISALGCKGLNSRGQ